MSSKRRGPLSDLSKKCKVNAEKRRKDRISNLISDLARVIPSHLLTTTSQIEVLSSSVKYIELLKEDATSLMSGFVEDIAKTEIETLKTSVREFKDKVIAYERVMQHAGIPSTFNPQKFVSDLDFGPVNRLEQSCSNKQIILLPSIIANTTANAESQTCESIAAGNTVHITNNYLLVPSDKPESTKKPKLIFPKAQTFDRGEQCELICGKENIQSTTISTQTRHFMVSCAVQTEKHIFPKLVSVYAQTENAKSSVAPESMYNIMPVTSDATASSRFSVDYLHNMQRIGDPSRKISTSSANSKTSTRLLYPSNTSKRTALEATANIHNKPVYKQRKTSSENVVDSNYSSFKSSIGSTNVVSASIAPNSSIDQQPPIYDSSHFDSSTFDTNGYWSPYNSFMTGQHNAYEWHQAFNNPSQSYSSHSSYCGAPQNSFSVSALAGNPKSSRPTNEITNAPTELTQQSLTKATARSSAKSSSTTTTNRRFEIAHIFPEESMGGGSTDATFAQQYNTNNAPDYSSYSQYSQHAHYPTPSSSGAQYYPSTLPHYDPWPVRQDHSALPSIFQLGNSNTTPGN